MSDSYDQQALSAMVDYWVSPLAVKKDFELSRGEYICVSYYFTLTVFLPSCCSLVRDVVAWLMAISEFHSTGKRSF